MIDYFYATATLSRQNTFLLIDNLFSTANIAKIYENNKKYGKICIISILFRKEYLDKSYALPRTGKDITVTQWDKNGKKTQKTLKWNGSGFSY